MSKSKFTVVVVEKTGKMKETVLSLTDKYDIHDTQYVYNFNTAHPHPFKVAVYAKSNGKAGQENKYEFPPPFDKQLFFDKCVLIKYNEHSIPTNLSINEWKKLYNNLYGGFEELGEEDEEEEEVEMEQETRMLNNPNIKFTKEGYIKDDMFVDDNEDIEVFGDDDEEEEEYKDEGEDEDKPILKKSKSKAKKSKKAKKQPTAVSSPTPAPRLPTSSK